MPRTDKNRIADSPARTAATEQQRTSRRWPYSRVADSIGLVAAAIMAVIFVVLHRSELLLTGRRSFLALGVALIFAFVGWRIGGVNVSGALAGAAIAFIMAARDLKFFLLLLLVFVLTFTATALGRERKQRLKAAEPSHGRSASQVLANLGVAALLLAIRPQAWTAIALAALTEAAADTTSSEIGLAFPGKTVLITTGREIPPGIDGGISLRGSIAAILASVTLALCARGLALVSIRGAVAIAGGGMLGTVIDSLLGATLQRRGLLTNGLVNLLSTGAAALTAYWLK